MIEIQFGDQVIPVDAGESVLDSFLRNGIDLPYGCRGGACQSCMLVAEKGEIPPAAQIGLKSTHKQLGYFLSCQCVPQSPLHVRLADQVGQIHESKVLERDEIAPNILRLRLQPVLQYQPGQYLNIWHRPSGDGAHAIRSYSIASVPGLDDFIELHIKVFESGRFSQWAKKELSVGDTLRVQGPIGECFYTAEQPEQPLLLIGIATGLAPLFGIARDALQKGHTGPIHLVLAAREKHGFYLQSALDNLSRDYPQFDVTYVCQTSGDVANEMTSFAPIEADIYDYIKTRFPSTNGMRVYLCGAASFVRKMKKQVFLAGAGMRDIHADAFLPCS